MPAQSSHYTLHLKVRLSSLYLKLALALELTQTRMTQRLFLRVELGVHALRMRA